MLSTAGFEHIEVPSQDGGAVDEVEVAVAGGDRQGGQAILAESGLSLADLAHKVASVKVSAYKPM